MSNPTSASERARPKNARAPLRENSPAFAPIADSARSMALRAAGPGVAWWGAVRLPLTVDRAPAAHLLGAPGERLRWWVRLPDATGAPEWTSLDGPTLEAWARDSGFPALVADIRRVERRARDLAGGVA